MKRPRGRPRGFDPEEALKAASERFRTLGYAATSLDDLAAATGLARPSLYAAFGDKKALYLAALARTHHRLEATFDALEAAALPKGTLLGTVATVVAIIAVAAVGFMMLTGRINWRYGATVIVGCFILFGAASIVAGIQSTATLGN